MNLRKPLVVSDFFGIGFHVGVTGYWKIYVKPVGGFIRTKRWVVKDASGLNTYTYFNCQDAIAKGIDEIRQY